MFQIPHLKVKAQREHNLLVSNSAHISGLEQLILRETAWSFIFPIYIYEVLVAAK